MRNKNVLNLKRSLPCMSWSPKNLYNLWRRTVGPKSEQIKFQNTTTETIFQQRWKSKAAVRAYHGDYIPEKSFKRWYLPDNLPDVRPRKIVAGDDKMNLEEYAQRKVREQDLEREIEKKGMAPVGSLMFSEVERRIDVFIFRCCFAHSIYEARRLVIHGDVMLNGKKHNNANTRLAPGDMVSVNPQAIRFLKNTPGYDDDVNHEWRSKYEPVELEEGSESTEGAEPSEPTTTAKPSEPKATAEPPKPTAAAESTESVESAETSQPSETPEDQESSTDLVLKQRMHVRESRYWKHTEQLTPFFLPHYASPWLFVPAYAEVSYATCSAVYVRHPTARPGYSEIPTPYDADGALIRFAWEWYVQRMPRMRSKSQLARMPEDRALERLREYYEEDVKLKKALWVSGDKDSVQKARDPLTLH